MAARRFFTVALTAHGQPDEVVADGVPALERVIEELTSAVLHNSGTYAIVWSVTTASKADHSQSRLHPRSVPGPPRTRRLCPKPSSSSRDSAGRTRLNNLIASSSDSGHPCHPIEQRTEPSLIQSDPGDLARWRPGNRSYGTGGGTNSERHRQGAVGCPRRRQVPATWHPDDTWDTPGGLEQRIGFML